MRITKFDNEKQFIEDSANFVLTEIIAQKNKDVFIGLSGGSTPEDIYRNLGSLPVNLSNVLFYLVDERCVPLDSPFSNFQMIKDTLTSKVKDKIKGFFYFDTSLPKAETIKKYEVELHMIPHKSFDLTILGIGEDGHFASIFPNTLANFDDGEIVCETTTEKFSVRERLSLSPRLILRSKKILVLLKGEKKKHILDKMTSNDETIKKEDFPAIMLKHHPNLTIHYLS